MLIPKCTLFHLFVQIMNRFNSCDMSQYSHAVYFCRLFSVGISRSPWKLLLFYCVSSLIQRAHDTSAFNEKQVEVKQTQVTCCVYMHKRLVAAPVFQNSDNCK